MGHDRRHQDPVESKQELFGERPVGSQGFLHGFRRIVVAADLEDLALRFTRRARSAAQVLRGLFQRQRVALDGAGMMVGEDAEVPARRSEDIARQRSAIEFTLPLVERRQRLRKRFPVLAALRRTGGGGGVNAHSGTADGKSRAGQRFSSRTMTSMGSAPRLTSPWSSPGGSASSQ